MTELKKLTDKELAERICKYIRMTESLYVRAEYFCGAPCPEKELKEITSDYSKLRKSIKADAEYAAFGKNGAAGSAIYENRFAPTVLAAAAHGFYAPDGTEIDKNFIKALEDGQKALVSIFSFDYWRILADE